MIVIKKSLYFILAIFLYSCSYYNHVFLISQGHAKMTESLCCVKINLKALEENYNFLLKQNKNLLPVIKNDAYGHGILEIGLHLQKLGANSLAVGTVNEGIMLRSSNFDGQILTLLGYTRDKEYELAKRHNLTTVVHDNKSLEASLEYKLNMAIKVDTGMGRLGFRAEHFNKIIKKIKQNNVLPTLLISHFSSSDCPNNDDYTLEQAKLMEEAENIFKNSFPSILTSFGNSATILAFPNLSGDLPRPGIVLYGGNPFYNNPRHKLAEGLQAVMTVTAPILSVHQIAKGECLSYGRSFVAKRNSVVAWVAIGYADGYRRAAMSNDKDGKGGIQVTIHERRCPVIGHINMQMTAVDITDLIKEQNVCVGDVAYILNGCNNGILIDELAMWWNTIPHEVTTTLGKNLYCHRY